MLSSIRNSAETKTQSVADNWKKNPAPATALKRLQPKKRGYPKGSRGRADPAADADHGVEAAPAAKVAPVVEVAQAAEAAQAVVPRS